MAGCYGIYAITPVDALLPTPFYFLAGYDESIGAGELQEHVATFYKSLFRGNSLSEAMKAVADKVPTFLAEKEFVIAMVQYFRGQARGKGKDARVEDLVTKWLAQNPDHSHQNFQDYRSWLKTYLKPSEEEFYRNANTFLHGRYSVNADDVLSFLETLHGLPQARAAVQ